MNGTHPPPPNNINHTGATDIHQPFTTAERIQQLSNVDNDVATLLTHLSSAMRALATPPGGTTTPTNDDDTSSSSDSLEAFRSSQTSFFNTIDRIDKHLTRQILAMEEAGIITLRSSGGAGETEAAQGGGAAGEPTAAGGPGGKAARTGLARLEPDGMGRYGALDVGKLNLASSTVERDMEGELWRRAKGEVKDVAVGRGDGEGDRMEE